MAFNKTGQTKRLLKLLGKNDCCNECPKLSEVEGNILECLEDGLYANVEEMVDTVSRFGFSGEDDQAAENRLFNHADFNFEIGDPSSSYYGLYLDNAYEFYLEMRNPDFVAASMGYIDLNASIGDGMVTFDFYVEGSNGATDSVELYFEPNLIQIILASASEFNIEGVGQDDTSLQVLALDSNANVKWIDKATIGVTPGQSIVFAKYDVVLTPTDASPNTGFNVPIQTGKRYAFEAFFDVTESSGVGYNINVNLPGTPGLSRFYVEFQAPLSGGEVDTPLIKREAVIGENTFNLPNASFQSPVGSPILKITGTIDTNDTAGDVSITAALDAAGPETGGLTGWIKLTELQ